MFTETARRSVRSRLGRRLVVALDALATPHVIDRYLELVDPAWSVRELRAVVTEVRRQTAGSVTLTLRPNGHWMALLTCLHKAEEPGFLPQFGHSNRPRNKVAP